MRTLRSAGLLALAVASLIAFASGSAAALRSLGIAPNEEVTARFLVEITESARITTVSCEMSLTERYLPSIAKRSGEILGIMRRIEFTGCIDNFGRRWTVTSTVEPGTPVNVMYNVFLGTLPNITGILAGAPNVGIRMRGEGGRPNCLFRGPLLFLISRLGEPNFNAKTFLRSPLRYIEGECGRESSIEIEGTLLYERAQALRVTLL
ncbi:MAG TPA: hypothetical protein VE972_09215 [Conexibacter sp.]|nr:hypothetical protein [Conexibacter sp.]